MTTPALSCYVDHAGAYVLAISAVPTEHLHRPLIVTVGDDTVLDETAPPTDTAWCAWCEEAQAPAYVARDGHDTECPLQGPRLAAAVRACELVVGNTFAEPGMDTRTVAGVAVHGDTILITTTDGGELALDADTVVQVSARRRAHPRD